MVIRIIVQEYRTSVYIWYAVMMAVEHYDHISYFDILLWGNGMQILLSTWKVVGNGYRYCSVPGIVVDLAVTTHK
jgi:hypothetical protein